MTERTNPFQLSRQIEEASVAQRQHVLARWDLDDVGVCPVCKQDGFNQRKMELVSAQGIPTFVCVDHCIALPAPDEVGLGAGL